MATIDARVGEFPRSWWAAGLLGIYAAGLALAPLMLPPLPIALGDSGPHVAIGFAAIGLFSGAVRLREWRIERDRLALALVAFFLILLCSSALAVFYSGADV